VAEYSKRVNSISKPIVGSMVYTHESGIHVHGQLRDPKSYQPFAPEEVSAKEAFVLGKHSGNSSIRNSLDQLNIRYNSNDISRLSAMIKDYSIANKKNLTAEELKLLTEQISYEQAV
jgi:homocitrate synthase NifV